MKRTIAIIITVIMLFSTVSCGGSAVYEPVASTEEEARVVMIMSIDGESYDIRYELYRALFLEHREELDGGDVSRWNGDGSEELIARMDNLIVEYASKIFGTIHLAKTVGYDPYSSEADEKVAEYVRISVEGNGTTVSGYGSYDKYLDALREMNLNYSVQDLMIRYSLSLEAINAYFTVGGHLDPTKDDIKSYYYGNDCVRVIQVYLQEGTRHDPEEVRNNIAVMSTVTDVSNYAIGFTTSSFEDVFDGVTIGRHALNSSYYSELTEAAFALQSGETSKVISVSGGNGGYYILYGLDKSDSHFEKRYESIRISYFNNEIGRLLDEASDSLVNGSSKSQSYSEIVHAEISMDR